MNRIKDSIFKIIEWTNNKNKKNYLFVGSDKNKVLINKLKNKSITNDEETDLKNNYNNFDLLKSSVQSNEEIIIIYKNIYEYDNIFTLKQKICMYIFNDNGKDVNHEHIYLWSEQKKNNYEIIDILNNIFNSNNELDTLDIKEIFESLFKFELINKRKTIKINEIYDIINSNNITTIHTPLELNYYDTNNDQKFIKAKPYSKTLKLYNNFVNDNGDFISNYEHRLDSFSILKNKLDKNIINYTTSESLLIECRNSKKIEKIINEKLSNEGNKEQFIFNGFIKPYFPYLSIKDINKNNNYNRNESEIIKKQDDVIHEIYEKQKISNVYSTETLVNKLHLRIYPNLNNNKFNKPILNLETLFNIFETTDDIPFISYRKKNNNLYKINKNALGNKLNGFDKKIDKEDIDKWTTNNSTRKIENISFHICLKNQEFDKTQYFTLILFENELLDIVYNMKSKESVLLSDIEESFININNLIKLINNELNIKILEINKDILYNTNVSFIEFIEFVTINNIIFNNSIQSLKNIEKVLKYSYPFFDIIKSDNNLLNFKYKKTDNYFNLDEIDVLIKNNMKLEENELVDKITETFSKINKTEARKLYKEKLPKLELNLIKNNRYIKSKINQGILIRLNIKNQVEIQLITKGLQDIDNNDMIVNLLSILAFDNKLIVKNTTEKDRKEQNKLLDKVMQNLIDNDKNQEDNNSQGYDSNSNTELEVIILEGGNDSNSNTEYNTDISLDDIDGINEDIDSGDDIYGDENIFEDYSTDKVNTTKDNLINNKQVKDNDINTDMEPSQDFNLKNLKDIEKNKGYNQLILKRLQWADNILTGYTSKNKAGYKTYGSHCGAVDKKQPIVLTKEELDFINKNYRGSYTNFIKTGSNPKLVDKYYYICPKIWCPLSKVSLTDEDLNKNKGKCPDGEPPLILDDKKNTWKKEINGELVDIDRYPYLLKKGLHPDGFEMPCCGKKQKTKIITDVFKDPINKEVKDNEENNDEENNDEEYIKKRKQENYINRASEKYIRKIIKQPVEPNKYATLPNKLSNILGNIGKSHGLINDQTNAFVRKGIESNNQYFMSCLISLMNNDKLKTVDDFNKLLDKNMTILDYIDLNNGNTLKLYLNSDKQIYEKKNFKSFKKWISNDKNKEYIKLMNLKDLITQLEGMNEFIYEDTNMMKSILREYLIYNSFTNFKYYLKSDLIKNHEEILQLFTNNYSWLNKEHYNIIVIHVEFIKDIENIEILCSKFINYKNKINNLKNFVLVLKLQNSYEPIVKVEFKNGDIIEKNNFNYFEDNEIKHIVNYQKNNCNNQNISKYINPIKLYNELELLKYKIKHIVLNMGFKVVGYIIDSNLYIPLDSNIFSSNIFKGTDIKPTSFVYLQDITKYKCNLSLPKIKNILTKLNDSLNTTFYEVDKSKIIENKDNISNKNIAIILEDGIVIPLNVTNNYTDIIIDSLNDEFIFIGTNTPDDAKSYMDNYVEKENEYTNKLKAVIQKISYDSIKLKKISNLKNSVNPFPKNIKLKKIKEIIITISKQINVILTDNDIDNIASDIYIKDISYILKKNNKKLKISKNEIVFNQEDIFNEKLEKLYIILLNPYKYIENSIEDYAYYVPIQLNNKLIKFKFITDIFLNLTPLKWESMLPGFSMNESIIDPKNKEQDTKDYFLKIFKKIGDISNKKITSVNLEKHIENKRKEDFKINKDLFIEEQKLNTYFMNEYNKLISFKENKDGVYSFNNIKEIFKNKNYKYSHYEIKKLSDFLKINIILLGKEHKNKLPNGIRCFYNNSNKYLLFHISNHEYDKYNIILKNRNKFILEFEDFPKRFISIINKYCKEFEIQDNSNVNDEDE